MRLNKFLSAAGIASRRDAEKIIEEGRVTINGEKAHHPGQQVEENDHVRVDDKPVQHHETTRVWIYYKPAGIITSHKDPEGRPTVFENVPKNLPRVVSVGRLDLNSEGLLLLTNAPSFAHIAENPKNEWKRTYRVRIYGNIDELQFDQLKRGVTIDGIRYKPIEIELSRQSGKNAWLLISLTEGKNREIRKVMNFLGYQVNRLIRISFGPFKLGNLKPGDIQEINSQQINKFFLATKHKE